MPRPRPLPTPSSSTDLGAEVHDKTHLMEGTFTLPPPAMNRSPPTSPTSAGLQRKRTLSGTAKAKADSQSNVDLPPPPSRARKIIQMKPKQNDDASYSSTSPTAPSKQAATTSPKRKQPSATSAAGRKIARKTAHSIIERRRRSKMNEEFGVLKDMIPACKGVEMHKLAILQAGIEYVRYLQGCVERLSAGKNGSVIEDNNDEEDEEVEYRQRKPKDLSLSSSDEAQYTYRRDSIATTATASTHPSPAINPTVSSSSLASQHQPTPALLQNTYSTSPPPLNAAITPTPTSISPAFNAVHFSPEYPRAQAYAQHAFSLSGKPSPSILPLPQSAVPLGDRLSASQVRSPAQGEGAAEATATAALMMLTNDRRATRGGMSVKDLLSG